MQRFTMPPLPKIEREPIPTRTREAWIQRAYAFGALSWHEAAALLDEQRVQDGERGLSRGALRSSPSTKDTTNE
jgi:hypothetical protein